MKQRPALQQTELAKRNFPFHVPPVHKEFIVALVLIKKAAAIANGKAGDIPSSIARAIARACDQILDSDLDGEISLPSFQGGAGTSINMNVNEVLAKRAGDILKTTRVHPNDHVNRSQSTNDVIPSALKICCLKLGTALAKDLHSVVAVFEQKAHEYRNVMKLGRTHLTDAVPITVGSEFASWAESIQRDTERFSVSLASLYDLPLGGTAVGNSVNASQNYRTEVYKAIRKYTGFPFSPAKNLMSQTNGQTDFCAVSQALTLVTLTTSRIANDIRILSSGPLGGIGEFILTELQQGSSIMPGKVNPVLPESVSQLYFFVSGVNVTVEHAAHAAQLELGVMLPVVADRLVAAIKLAREVLVNFATKCVATITVSEKRCRQLLEQSTAYATVFTPVLGYDTMSSIVKEAVASDTTIRALLIQKKLLTEKKINDMIQNYDAACQNS